MTKPLTLAAAAMLVMGGAQAAYAQVLGPCAVEAAATQQECLATGNPPGECAAYYRDDLAECYAYGSGPIGGPIGPRRFSAPRRVSAPHPGPAPRAAAAPRAAPAPHAAPQAAPHPGPERR
jgi:hypothetical protein